MSILDRTPAPPAGPPVPRVVPFRQFLLKVHSRCNLACDHCYVYEAADQTWRDRPHAMSAETVRRVAARIAEHARGHRLDEVRIVLHGGEPLLLGYAGTAELLETLERGLRGVPVVRLSLQTNGVLLTERYLDLFAEYDVRVGVSLDGDRAANDHHRRYANGRSSYSGVVRGLRLLGSPAYRELFAGLLCTVDLAHDPLATLDALMRFSPPMVDLLLPHGTHESPPPGRVGIRADDAPYGRWLITVFDAWYDSQERPGPRVRLFEEVLALVMGGTSRSEAIGLSPVDLVVVETDGTIEQVDSLKAAYHGAPATGLDVFAHSFDAALHHEAFLARHRGMAALGPTCRACPVVQVCGGGLYTHRYRADGTGFANPSVYCADLRALIDHAIGRVRQDVERVRAGRVATRTASP